jgi:hypothetical protein
LDWWTEIYLYLYLSNKNLHKYSTSIFHFMFWAGPGEPSGMTSIFSRKGTGEVTFS